MPHGEIMMQGAFGDDTECDSYTERPSHSEVPQAGLLLVFINSKSDYILQPIRVVSQVTVKPFRQIIQPMGKVIRLFYRPAVASADYHAWVRALARSSTRTGPGPTCRPIADLD
jgi:hypothetical protein